MYYLTRHWSACYRCTAVLQVTVHMGLPAAHSSTGRHPLLRADVKGDEQGRGAQNVQLYSDFSVMVSEHTMLDVHSCPNCNKGMIRTADGAPPCVCLHLRLAEGGSGSFRWAGEI